MVVFCAGVVVGVVIGVLFTRRNQNKVDSAVKQAKQLADEALKKV
jgi:uncharacterized membrane-anchored protein YhcB (DUF1043 family)